MHGKLAAVPARCGAAALVVMLLAPCGRCVTSCSLMCHQNALCVVITLRVFLWIFSRAHARLVFVLISTPCFVGFGGFASATVEDAVDWCS